MDRHSITLTLVGLAALLPLGCRGLDSLTLEDRAAEVEISVTDASGTPLPDATVQLWWRDASATEWTPGVPVGCDGDGAAHAWTHRLRHQHRYRIRAQVDCDGYGSADREWSGCRGGDALQWDCVLEPALDLHGLVQTPVGPVLWFR